MKQKKTLPLDTGKEPEMTLTRLQSLLESYLVENGYSAPFKPEDYQRASEALLLPIPNLQK